MTTEAFSPSGADNYRQRGIIVGNSEDLRALRHYFSTVMYPLTEEATSKEIQELENYFSIMEPLFFQMRSPPLLGESLIFNVKPIYTPPISHYGGGVSGLYTAYKVKSFINGIMVLQTGAFFEGEYIEFRFLELNDLSIEGDILRNVFDTPSYPISYRSKFSKFKLEDTKADLIYERATQDGNLASILINLSKGWGWDKFYTIYEIIKDDLSEDSQHKSKKQEMISEKLNISQKQQKEFTKLANNSRNPFEGMRHGSRPKLIVSNPHALGLGFEFIQDLVIKWINYRYSIEVKKSTLDAKKCIKAKDKEEDFKFATHTESYYEHEKQLKRLVK